MYKKVFKLFYSFVYVYKRAVPGFNSKNDSLIALILISLIETSNFWSIKKYFKIGNFSNSEKSDLILILIFLLIINYLYLIKGVKFSKVDASLKQNIDDDLLKLVLLAIYILSSIILLFYL